MPGLVALYVQRRLKVEADRAQRDHCADRNRTMKKNECL